MDIFTVDRDYKGADIIDDYTSVIWTERYYGDSEFELVLPMRRETFERIPPGILIGCSKSDELMVVEEGTIQGGSITYKGIGILPWLNNRFVRYSPIQSTTTVDSGPLSNVGSAMWEIVLLGATEESPALNADWALYGLPFGYGDRLKIPGLGLRDFDSVPNSAAGTFSFTREFGPVYDSVRKLAEAYEVGCKIDWKPGFIPILGFRAYRGVDRTSQQHEFPVIRFSPLLDTLTDITELYSKSKYKNLAFSYSTNAPLDYTTPGIASTDEASEASGFDLRSAQVLVDDMGDGPLPYEVINEALSGDARNFLGQNRYIRAIDGQIIPSDQIRYGRDYSLGDLVEEQGETGAVSIGRVMEFIRAQDKNGYREYPTIGETQSVNTTLGYFAPAPAAVPDPPPPPPPEITWTDLVARFGSSLEGSSTRDRARQIEGVYWDGSKLIAQVGNSISIDDINATTWKFESGAWTELSPATQIKEHYGAAFCQDVNPAHMITFGGYYVYASAPTNDMHRFNGSTWSTLSPTHKPSARYNIPSAMVKRASDVLLFGGNNDSIADPDNWLGDTWLWDGTDWTEQTPAHSPVARAGANLAWDPVGERVILFGGYTHVSIAGPLSDTWQYKDGDWTELSPTTHPDAGGGAFGWDGTALVMFGENSSEATTWAFDVHTDQWTEYTPTVHPTYRYAFLVFDGTRGVLVGAAEWPLTDDTWSVVGPS